MTNDTHTESVFLQSNLIEMKMRYNNQKHFVKPSQKTEIHSIKLQFGSYTCSQIILLVCLNEDRWISLDLLWSLLGDIEQGK